MDKTPCALPNCPRVTGVAQRVECVRCRAHRDLTIAPRCLVCGAEAFTRVLPTAGDVGAIEADVVKAAELVDLAAHDAGVRGLDERHPALEQLRRACRALALARAGRLAT